MTDRQKNFRALLVEQGLAVLAYRYAEHCWSGWKAGRQQMLDNPERPFIGAAPAGTEIELVSGEKKVLTGKERVRINEVSDTTLEQLGVLEAAKISRANGRETDDVFHPEFQPTFQDLRALDVSFVANNAAATCSLFLWLGDEWGSETTTVGDFLDWVEQVTSDRETIRLMNFSQRHSWIGRVLAQGGEHNSAFTWAFQLVVSGKLDLEALDSYVIAPVLTKFALDIESGEFDLC